jgi:hypothetical protein
MRSQNQLEVSKKTIFEVWTNHFVKGTWQRGGFSGVFAEISSA